MTGITNTNKQHTGRTAGRVTTLNALLQRLILVCVLPLLLLAVNLAYVRVLDLQARSLEAATRLAGNFATALDDNLAARIAGLQVLAASGSVKEPPQLAPLYQQALAYRDNFGGEVIFADRSMQMLLNTRAEFGAVLPKISQQAGYAAAPQALADGKPVVGDKRQGHIVNGSLVTIAVPVMREGVTRYLLLNVIETRILQQRLDGLILPPAWVLTLFDGSGEVLARRGPTPLHADEHRDMQERIVIKSAVSRWSAVLEIPRAAYLAPIIEAVGAVLALILLATLMSVLGGRLAGRRLSRAVATLTATASLPHMQADTITEIEEIRTKLDAAQSHRLSAEARLLESEGSFRELFEHNPQPMWTFDLETLAFLSVNDAAVAQYGFSREEFLAMTTRDMRSPEDIPALLAHLQETKTAPSATRISRHRRKDGSEIIVEIQARTVEAGSRPARLVLAHDVTEAYNMRQALARTTELLERVSELAKVGGWELDVPTGEISWSRETFRIHELDPGVAPGVAGVLELYAPEARPIISAAVQAAIDNGTPFDLELPHFTAKGRPSWVRAQAVAIMENGKAIKVLGAFHDITERKRAEAAVRNSDAFTSAILDSVTAEIVVLEQDGTIIAVNESWRRVALENGLMNGKPAPRTGIGTNYLAVCETSIDGTIDAIALQVRDGIRGVLDGSLPCFTLEYPCHSPQQQRWFTLIATPLGSGAGRAVIAHSDITRRMQAEAKLAAIINSSLDAIITIDDAERVLVFNTAAEQLFRLPAADAIGQTLDRFIPARFRSAHRGHIREFMASGVTSRKMGQFTRLTALRQDGMEVPIEASIAHIIADGKHFFTVTLRDVSERAAADAIRESLEEQLRQSQKMEAIGTLAGGIAHDFNNILATILGNADLAHQELGNDARVAESLAEIRKAGGRARDLVQQILSFSRRQATELLPTSLGPVVEEAARLMRATLPVRVKIDLKCDPNLPLVQADATQVKQILINLMTNAAQAMQLHPGQIRVELDSVALDATLVGEHPALLDMRKLRAKPSGRIVRLTVRDDGPGMNAATLKRVFEPFFTTKPPGEGTGLGLSVVHGIVQAHGGTIVVDSEPGKGTTFTLYLPPSPMQSGVSPAEKSSADPIPFVLGARHILYIDDDESLVFLVKRLMERRGCRISGFTDQREGLDALRADPASFDLVVTDYNMPGMSGLDVAREVRAIRADLPVAIASGFIDEALQTQANGAGVRELIFKASAVEDLCDAFVRLAQTVT